MKTLFKSKAALVIMLAGLAFSCKKNETAPADSYNNDVDTTETTIDSVGTTTDTTTTTTGTGTGTTGTTGGGSNTDSTATAPKQ
jgi:hypothetical protein